MKSVTDTIINAADVANNIESEWVDMRFNYGYAIQATFTGSPSGSVVVEGSNDKSALTQISTTTITGTNTIGLNQDAVFWPWIRVKKAAGGVGTLSVSLTLKGV